MVTFTPHLSVTIKRLARYKQKVVLAAMLDGKSMPSNMAANTNHTTLLKNQSAIKHLPQMRSISNFGCKIIFMCSVDFWHQQDSNSLFRGSIGHVTSSCKWPIRPTQAVLASHGAIKDYPGNLSQSQNTAGFPPFALSKLILALPPSPHLPISLAASTRIFVTSTLVASLAAVFWMSRNAGGVLRDIQKTAARETCTLVNLNLFPQT